MGYILNRILSDGRLLREGKIFPNKKLAEEAAEWYRKRGFEIKVSTAGVKNVTSTR